jgi:hypothetical protein
MGDTEFMEQLGWWETDDRAVKGNSRKELVNEAGLRLDVRGTWTEHR